MVGVLVALSLPHAKHPSAAYQAKGSSSLGARTAARQGARPSAGRRSATPATSAPVGTRTVAPSGGPTGRAARSRGGATSNSAGGASGQGAVQGTTTPTTSAGAPASPAVNLAVPAGFGVLLRQVWVSADPGNVGLANEDVESTLPGSVYYAEQPAIANFWAISGFVPSEVVYAEDSTPAGRELLAQFNYVAVFNKAPGQGWDYVGSFPPGSCSPKVPAPVYTAWDLCQVGS